MGFWRDNNRALAFECDSSMMLQLHGVEGIARAFNVIMSERCTVASQSQDCSSGIWWTVNHVFLVGITDVCEDQVLDGCTNTWMRISA